LLRGAIGAGILVLFCLSPGQPTAGQLDKPSPLHLTHGNASLDVIVERGIMRFTARPASPLDQRIEGLRSLLSSFFADHPKERRYTLTLGEYPELNARMASAASCSQQWDTAAGRVRSGDSNAWLRKTLGETEAFREVVPVFDAFGYGIDIGSMESIAVCGLAEIDWAGVQRSCQTPIPRGAKLPCGALITFAVTAK
jgi:hypothetical protein